MFPRLHDGQPVIESGGSDSRCATASAGSHQVHLVIYPGFKLMEAVGPVSVLSYANRHLALQGDSRRYEIHIVAPQAGRIPSDTLISLEASAGLPEREALSTVLVAGALDIETAVAREAGLVDWCRRRAASAKRFAALCSGSFFLANAGVLSGRRAATHWSVATLLQQRFPSVEVDADAIFIQEGNMWTSAGVTAAIDLTLAFVEQDFGRNLALTVARDLVIYLKRPGGQSQFSDLLNSQMTAAPEIRDVQSWVMSNLSKPLQLEDMADKAGMSVRNFTRLFKEEVGISPASYLVRARCERTATLLLDSDLPLKTIASRVGFPTEEQMRKAFVRQFSLTPRAYRARFSTSSLKSA
jgi:transcriptional regulator GlxA family with amidase domain